MPSVQLVASSARRGSGSDSGFCHVVSSNTDVNSEVGARSTSGLEIGRGPAGVVTSGVSGDATMEIGSGVEPLESDEFSIQPGGHPDRTSLPRGSAVYSRPPKGVIRPGA